MLKFAFGKVVEMYSHKMEDGTIFTVLLVSLVFAVFRKHFIPQLCTITFQYSCIHLFWASTQTEDTQIHASVVEGSVSTH